MMAARDELVAQRPPRSRCTSPGIQHHDGSASRDIVVHQLHADEPISLEQARQLAAVLTEVVAEVEKVSGYDLIVVS